MLNHYGLALDPDEVAAQHLGHGAGCAGAEERIKDHVTGVGGTDKDAMKERFGLLGGVRLASTFVL